MPFFLVYWDISGVCNAACRYCPSGSKNVLGNLHKSQAGFLSPKDFIDSLTYLCDKKIIDHNTHIGLYSWGEPYLHPQFEEMMNIVSDLGFTYSLSTNASVVKKIPVSALHKLQELKFSMPGFSQASYDRQHGFDFNVICENIKTIILNIRSQASHVKFKLIYQVYKSNRLEAKEAFDFCSQLDIEFDPLWAIRTGFTMPATVPLFKENNFCTEKWEQISKLQSADWVCPQYGILVLDEFSNVIQCCVTDRYVQNFIIGNIREVDFDKLTELRMNADICKSCVKSGIGFLAHYCFAAAGIDEILKQEK